RTPAAFHQIVNGILIVGRFFQHVLILSETCQHSAISGQWATTSFPERRVSGRTNPTGSRPTVPKRALRVGFASLSELKLTDLLRHSTCSLRAPKVQKQEH